MSSKFFGEFLLEKGVISREVLAEAVKVQQGVKRPLLALAIQKGLLDEKALAELDREVEQADGDSVDVEISEKSVSFRRKGPHHGMSDKGLFLAEALVNEGWLKLADLKALFEEYQREVLKEDQPFWLQQHIRESILPCIIHRKVVSFFLQMTINCFVSYTKQAVDAREITEAIDFRDSYDFTFSQQVLGDCRFFFCLLLPESLVLAIGSHVLGRFCNAVDDAVLDALKEFLNIVVGNALRMLSAQGYTLSARAPTVSLKGGKMLFPHSGEVAVGLKSAIEKFHCMFFFEDRDQRSPIVWNEDKVPGL